MKRSILADGKKHSSATKYRARELRKQGWTHREIIKELGMSLASAALWTKGIVISAKQKTAIFKRRAGLSTRGRKILSSFARKRSRIYGFQKKYTRNDLLKRINNFFELHGRIPLKREFNSNRVYRKHFGTWNNAIKEAGFETNRVLFAKKFIARDGHTCDSFTEKVIDDYLSSQNIFHLRDISYPGHKKYRTDFKIGEVFVEFFGLAKEMKSYDVILKRKRELCKKFAVQLIELYPNDIYGKGKLFREKLNKINQLPEAGDTLHAP